MDIPAVGDRLKTTRPVAALRQGRRDWYRIENAAGKTGAGDTEPDDTTVIYIFDEIGFFGVSAGNFITDLAAVTTPNIELHLNTPGGEIFDGLAIYSALRAHPAQVTCIVDAAALSIGSVICQAADRRIMMPNATMMIHDGSGLCIGDAEDMRSMATILDAQSDNIASIYADRAGAGTTAEWRAAMLAESWYSAEEAVKAGLADEVGTYPPPGKTSSPPRDEWDLKIYAYASREQAPAPYMPEPPQVSAPPPPLFDFATFRAAILEAHK